MWKEFIDKNLIVINPEVKSKEELFESMVNHAYNSDYIINKKDFISALKKREKVSNTELIEGVAFPHARSNAVVKVFLSIIILRSGLDYGNPDMGPVKIIFFFGCSEENAREYLQILAKSSRLLKDKTFRELLENAESPDQVVEILEEYSEEELDEGGSGKCLMIFTVHDMEKQSEIFSAMVEAGITNATIIEGSSLAKKIAYEIPVFAGLSYLSQGKSKRSDLIVAFLENRSSAYRLKDLLKKNGIDLDKPGTGFMNLIDVDTVIGNHEENIEI